jgi:hypothetical protein
VPSLADQADRFAETLAAAKCYTDATVVAEPAVEAARQQGQLELFWRAADHLASYLERTGRLDQAMSLWHEALDAGSTIPRTFDRPSLALDRAGHPSAAVQVCDIGLARFSDETRRSNLALRIENGLSDAVPKPCLPTETRQPTVPDAPGPGHLLPKLPPPRPV